eukprot:gene10354-8290_t
MRSLLALKMLVPVLAGDCVGGPLDVRTMFQPPSAVIGPLDVHTMFQSSSAALWLAHKKGALNKSALCHPQYAPLLVPVVPGRGPVVTCCRYPSTSAHFTTTRHSKVV